MQLNFIKSGNGFPLIILHGLFGMLDNWKTVGKALEEKFTVYLIDQRNHGKSPHVPQHSYTDMADDLNSFFEQQKITRAHIIGHSMGGKTAIQFAIDHPEKVETLIVVDMGIKRYPGGHDAIFEALLSFDLSTLHSRKEAEVRFAEKIADKGVQQFLLKNLTRDTDGTYHWKFNLKALSDNYEDNILSGISQEKNFSGKTIFIRGERSDYILDGDWKTIQELFPNSTLITVSGAGHWVHADQPEELLKSLFSIL